MVHGLDDKEPQWTESGVFLSTPDMLTFSREMYAVNIESGRVDGDVIHYRTIYGMEFTAFGAKRTSRIIGYTTKMESQSLRKMK